MGQSTSDGTEVGNGMVWIGNVVDDDRGYAKYPILIPLIRSTYQQDSVDHRRNL